MKTYQKVLVGAIVGFAIGTIVANASYMGGGAQQRAASPAAAQSSPLGYFPAEYQLEPSADETPVFEY